MRYLLTLALFLPFICHTQQRIEGAENFWMINDQIYVYGLKEETGTFFVKRYDEDLKVTKEYSKVIEGAGKWSLIPYGSILNFYIKGEKRSGGSPSMRNWRSLVLNKLSTRITTSMAVVWLPTLFPPGPE